MPQSPQAALVVELEDGNKTVAPDLADDDPHLALDYREAVRGLDHQLIVIESVTPLIETATEGVCRSPQRSLLARGASYDQMQSLRSLLREAAKARYQPPGVQDSLGW